MKEEVRQANWYVAWICCFLTFLLLGLARLSSLLFVAVMDHYGVSRAEASLPFVLCYTVRNVAGPLIGYLGRRWGFHKVCISGCILSTLGIGSCFFADDIVIVTILWGGVFGLGLGLTTILIPEVLRQHFTADIAKANGIAFAGECVAGFVLPVLFDISLNKYGTQGTFLILSGLILNSLPAALFLTQMKPITKSHPAHQHRKIDNVSEKNDDSDENDSSKNSSHSISQSQPAVKKSEKTPCFPENSRSFYYSSADHSCALNNYHRSSNDYARPINCHNTLSQDYSVHEISSERRKSDSHAFSNAPATNENNSAFRSFTVFFDITFILILIGQSLFIYITTTALTIVVDYSKDIGVVGQEEVYIVMGISIADMVGRFGLGFITDSGYMTKTAFTASCYTVMGLLLLLTVWVRGFALLMTTMLPFGLLLGGLLIVFPGIVSDFVEEDKVTMALASRLSLYGPLSLSQSPLIGFFRSRLGSYDGVYYTLTILCFLCSGLTILTPMAAKRRDLRMISKLSKPKKVPI
ncbi:monocarboxylate transporter 12 [Parasteatoda tepidariorum]|uniref:monocarboxylate transporter 12 n=1 Tax=Parasteatoda tepidariorum TaxID=114398 RepID=UPI001C7255EF|nr:monocarboxylate transporter 3 [Parasteatoda tepidariorum]XP_042901969.1 monocarboxylate transporter 3 [Parasteatoda tepidariorum]XP_042901970.1 monocarboxylate transporter 3 [Parasteatoda tepidariorum]